MSVLQAPLAELDTKGIATRYSLGICSWVLRSLYRVGEVDEYYDGEEITEESESEDTESDESDEEVIEEPFVFDWDGLAYPRAFEDMYDPIWRD